MYTGRKCLGLFTEGDKVRINWNNKTLVRFTNGEYRVRRGWFLYEYFDIGDGKWWRLRSSSSTYDHATAVQWLNYKKSKKDWGTPVSIIPPPPGR